MQKKFLLVLGACLIFAGCSALTTVGRAEDKLLGISVPPTPIPTSGSTQEDRFIVYAINESPMNATRFSQMIEDLNFQATRDFGPAWQIWFVIEPATAYNAQQFSIRIRSVANGFPYPQYHSLDYVNTADVNYDLCHSEDPSDNIVSAAASHEILQRLVFNFPGNNPTVGICDVCGGNGYSPLNSTLGDAGDPADQVLSDFAYPAFEALQPAAVVNGTPVYDFLLTLKAPLTPLPGGQLLYVVDSSGQIQFGNGTAGGS